MNGQLKKESHAQARMPSAGRLCQPTPAANRIERRRLQHGIRYTGLPRRSRRVETPRAGAVCGLHRLGRGSATLLGRSYLAGTGSRRQRRTMRILRWRELERRGFVENLITQNVDDLHRRAGSRNVVDLHGVLRIVRCLGCGAQSDRADLQAQLERQQCRLGGGDADHAPDGDAHARNGDIADFVVPDCARCGGFLKPDVVFFGENVPRDTRAALRRKLQRFRCPAGRLVRRSWSIRDFVSSARRSNRTADRHRQPGQNPRRRSGARRFARLRQPVAAHCGLPGSLMPACGTRIR